jgi:hypothetical protein
MMLRFFTTFEMTVKTAVAIKGPRIGRRYSTSEDASRAEARLLLFTQQSNTIKLLLFYYFTGTKFSPVLNH